MKSLHFENDGALQLALTTGLVPEDLAGSPAGVLRDGDGKLVVFPSESIKRAAELKLAAAGVSFVKESREPTRQVGCWAQILLPRRTGSEPEKGPVLFVVPEGDSVLKLGAEMLRLGCDRQDFCIVPSGGPCLLRAIDPPYFTLASILDGSRRLQAFVPTPPGQDKVWTELGHSHPLADSLKAPECRLLLVGSDGSWREVADGPWTNLYSVLELQVPGAPHHHEKQPVPPRLQVRLRLAKASRNEPTALFVLRQNAVEQVDTLVRGCSDELVQRLLFAATGDPKNPTIILRARPGRQAPPELQLNGEAYVPLLATGQLFIPRDASLEPPLRKEKVRDLLAPGTDENRLAGPYRPVRPGQDDDRRWLPGRADRRGGLLPALGLGRVPRPRDAGPRVLGEARDLRLRLLRVHRARVGRRPAPPREGGARGAGASPRALARHA
ncbi:MAG: hypothetical protein QM765_20755 [Myxococcales bacterium]